LNLETADVIRILIIAVVLFAGLGLLKLVLKLTMKVLALGCLGVVIILAVLLIMSVMA